MPNSQRPARTALQSAVLDYPGKGYAGVGLTYGQHVASKEDIPASFDRGDHHALDGTADVQVAVAENLHVAGMKRARVTRKLNGTARTFARTTVRDQRSAASVGVASEYRA